MKITQTTFVLDRTKFKTVTDRAVNAGLTRAAVVAVKAIKMSFSKNGKFRPSAPGTPPNRNRGLLANSIASTKAENKVAYVYTSGVAYARIQEFGGVIRRFDRLLTVPLNQEAARMRERTYSLYSQHLFFMKTKSGRKILFDARNKRSKVKSLRPMFLLTSTVKMPPRPYMAPAFRNPTVIAEMTKAFCQASKATLLGVIS